MSWDHANEALTELIRRLGEERSQPPGFSAAIPMVVGLDGVEYPVREAAEVFGTLPDTDEPEVWTVTYSTPDPTAGTYGMGVFE